jgi:hypothetical protein
VNFLAKANARRQQPWIITSTLGAVMRETSSEKGVSRTVDTREQKECRRVAIASRKRFGVQ